MDDKQVREQLEAISRDPGQFHPRAIEGTMARAMLLILDKLDALENHELLIPGDLEIFSSLHEKAETPLPPAQEPTKSSVNNPPADFFGGR